MEICAPRRPLRIVLSFFLIILAFVVFYFSFTLELKAYQSSLGILVALGFLIGATVAFFSYFSQPVLLQVSEEGVLTMYLFYLPWEFIEEFYIRDDFFVEIKLKDNEKYLEQLDRDLYCSHYDEMEIGMLHGHEMFFFPVEYMGLSCQVVLDFLNGAKAKYSK